MFVMTRQIVQTDDGKIGDNDRTIQVGRQLWTADSPGLNKRVRSLIETAQNQLGTENGKKYWKWYGYDKPVDWCGCFVSWCVLRKQGVRQSFPTVRMVSGGFLNVDSGLDQTADLRQG